MRIFLTLLAALAVGPVLAEMAGLVGLGVVRSLPIVTVSTVAVLLTILPIVGLHSLLGRQLYGFVVSVWTWPLLCLAALPGYFPGEFPGAISTGLAVFVSAGGPEMTEKASRLGSRVPVGNEGTAPPPQAARAEPDCARSAVPLAGDQVALPYEGSGHSMTLPVESGSEDLTMLFDTGASVTTMSAATLARLKIAIAADAPTLQLRTANGERRVQLVLVDKLWIGGLPVEGVTVGVCEECADEKTAGLLGLNVSGQFLVTVDTARKEVVFQARAGEQDRLIDVAPWLHVEATAKVYPDTRVEVEVSGANASDRVVKEATIGLQCGDERFTALLTNVPPHGTATTLASLPRATDCTTYRVSLDHARW